MNKNLTSKVALVTGGARGIGRAISHRLAAAGAFVFVNYSRSENEATAVVEEIRAAGGNAQALRFDVGAPDEVEVGIKSLLDQGGKLDILVNNAGIAIDSLLLRNKVSDWQRTLDVNLSGAFYCARFAAKSMVKERGGRIINMSSVIGEMGNAGQAAYSASKAGLIGLTKSLARELASREITVNAIAPGYIVTDMTAALSEDIRNSIAESIPLGRLGTAEDVAETVAFLASPAAAYITGQVIGVNGGMYM